MQPKLNEKQFCLTSGLRGFLLNAKTCVLASLLATFTFNPAVSGESKPGLNGVRVKTITQSDLSANAGLLVTVTESPRIFERAGQRIKLTYVIKNISGKTISNEVYVADSDALVVCRPKNKKVLLPGATVQCKSTMKIDQQHFVDGEMRHNFLAVSGGEISNMQESVICRKGRKRECDTNTQIICDLHRDLKTSAARPDICDVAMASTRVPIVNASKCREPAGVVFIDSDKDHRADESEAGLVGVTLRSSNGAVAITDNQGKYLFPCPKVSRSGVEASDSIHIDEPSLPVEFKLASRKSQLISRQSPSSPIVNFALHRKQLVTVDLLPSAFAPNQTVLLPTWKVKLGTVVQIVSREKSLLKIILRAGSDPLSLSQARVSKVKSDLLSVLTSGGHQNLPEIEMLVIGRLTN